MQQLGKFCLWKSEFFDASARAFARPAQDRVGEPAVLFDAADAVHRAAAGRADVANRAHRDVANNAHRIVPVEPVEVAGPGRAVSRPVISGGGMRSGPSGLIPPTLIGGPRSLQSRRSGGGP